MSQTQTATGIGWVREITRYQWMVFLIAWLGWSLDVTDFNLFALVLRPALTELLGNPPLSEIGRVGGLRSLSRGFALGAKSRVHCCGRSLIDLTTLYQSR